ncbi:ATP-binding protein [Sphingobacterium mizutaii]|uniref:tetratricopeptide repeat-containing sensor histidine kinase n=1 Tax=Sphingobacterium mizutaii TaxID=1010 RepID=UPI0016284D6C|nr:ATP-binding protein [Sphingobacterium mizutaii]
MKPLLLLTGLLLLVSCKNQITSTQESEKNPYYEQAYDFLDKNEFDSAFVYFEKAKSLFLERDDSVGVAESLINMAVTQSDFGDYYGSQETSTKAIEYLNLNDTAQYGLLGMVYNNLSNVYTSLKDTEKSIEANQLAIRYAANPANKKVYENNLASTYIANREYQKAIEILKKLLSNTDSNSIDYARFLTNYARAKSHVDTNYRFLPVLRKAMLIRQKKKDPWGLNSSYSHMANYYKERNKDSALYYSKQQYEAAKAIKNPDAQMDALQRMLELSVLERNQSILERYHKIQDSVEIARMTAKNQFALIRYEVEKSKTNNLKLSNEVAEKQYRLNLMRVFIVGLLIVAALTSFYFLNWHKRRKQRMELEAENRVKESQLKTSRKVHDVVANGIYRVMAELENRDDINREELLDRLEILYDKSRDISYEVEDLGMDDIQFHLTISELLKSFSNEDRTILIAGNEEAIWEKFNALQKDNLEQVLQELLVNMQKHSKAQEVIVRFDYDGNNLHVHYKDDGIGLSDSLKYGNGFKNTENRINLLKGTLTFEKNNNRGLGIHISIPIQK